MADARVVAAVGLVATGLSLAIILAAARVFEETRSAGHRNHDQTIDADYQSDPQGLSAFPSRTHRLYLLMSGPRAATFGASP